MPTFDLRAETHWIALAILIACGAIDGLLGWLGGNESTLSKVFLNLEGHRPHVCLLMSYSAAVLVRHLSIPTFDPMPELWVSVFKAIVVCLPILAVFGEIAAAPVTGQGAIVRLAKHNRFALEAMMVVGTLLGWAAAAWGVPQHLSKG